MSHQDQVIELPKDTDVLASNAHCPFYMLQIGNNLTIQGHPEFTKDYSKALIEYRHDLLDPLCYEKGLQSLALPEDKRIIAQWITHFLHDKSEHD